MPTGILATREEAATRAPGTGGRHDRGGARAVARCDLLGAAPYSDAPDMLYRGYLTPAHRATVNRVAGWMTEAGMIVRLDPAANLVGRYEGEAAGAPALMIGSHLDSVRDGGRYDGPLGVMLGIECVAALAAEGRRLPFAIEVIGFGDEEGSRFPAAMLTSRAVAGTLDPAMLDVADGAGVSLADALATFDDYGTGKGPPFGSALDRVAAYHEAKRAPASILAYLETHIEQGPVLEAEGRAVGVVTGIAAQRRYALTVRGRAGHAGTTAMPLRADALAGAAEMVLAVERIARDGPDGLVATVGRLDVSPGAANVVPGSVAFTVDVRAGHDDVRDAAADAILAACAAIAARRYLALSTAPLQTLPASPCDPSLTDLLAQAVTDLGLPARRLVSGAGHDAMLMAALCPTAMLFIRCAGGISHNPAESVAADDCDVALDAMLGFVDRLAAAHG